MLFVGQVSGLVENIRIGMNPDTINVINIKLFMMALLVDFMPLSVTLAILQSHSNVEQFKFKILCSYPVKLKLSIIVK